MGIDTGVQTDRQRQECGYRHRCTQIDRQQCGYRHRCTYRYTGTAVWVWTQVHTQIGRDSSVGIDTDAHR